MPDHEYVTIREGARRYRVSDKKLQRAIRAEKLPARYPKPNRCEMAIADLEQFLSGHASRQSTEPLERRVAEQEQRVAELEEQIQPALSRQEGARKHRTSPAKERTTGPLPRQFVPLLTFARQHNVAESKALAAIEVHYVPVKRGTWTDREGTAVTLALDSSGRQAFYRLYHGVPPFVECDQCPHSTAWTDCLDTADRIGATRERTRGWGTVACSAGAANRSPRPPSADRDEMASSLPLCRLPSPRRVPSRAG